MISEPVSLLGPFFAEGRGREIEFDREDVGFSVEQPRGGEGTGSDETITI